MKNARKPVAQDAAPAPREGPFASPDGGGSPLRRLLGILRLHHLEHEPGHVLLMLAAGAALALAAVVGVAWAAGFTTVAHHLRHPHLLWLPLALAGSVVAHTGYLLAYREVARPEEGPRLGFTRAGALVATGFGMFVPRGGFALDLEALRDLGLPAREARVRVLGLGSLEYAVLATGAWISALLLLVRQAPAEPAVTLSWVVGVPAGAALALLALRYRSLLYRLRAGLRLQPALEGIDVVGAILVGPWRRGLVPVTGMAAYWVGEVFALWACLTAFSAGHHPSVPAVVVGYAAGYALTRRTLPLGGAGAVEALLPFALTWVGEPLATAVLGVVAYRIVNAWLPLGPALAGRVALRRQPPPRRA